MPTRLPDRPRAKSIRADHRNTVQEAARTRGRTDTARRHAVRGAVDTIDTVDWLALWALSLAASAVFIAALVYFNEGDVRGAAAVLAGTACIMAAALLVTVAPDNDG